jgi:hypothetical protein
MILNAGGFCLANLVVRMGESSFSKGFGQINPNQSSGDAYMDEVWGSIPKAIFDGLADRYKVRNRRLFVSRCR